MIFPLKELIQTSFFMLLSLSQITQNSHDMLEVRTVPSPSRLFGTQ